MATRNEIVRTVATKTTAANTKHSTRPAISAAAMAVLSDNDITQIAMKQGGLVT